MCDAGGCDAPVGDPLRVGWVDAQCSETVPYVRTCTCPTGTYGTVTLPDDVPFLGCWGVYKANGGGGEGRRVEKEGR
jgi:hypothetical protein